MPTIPPSLPTTPGNPACKPITGPCSSSPYPRPGATATRTWHPQYPASQSCWLVLTKVLPPVGGLGARLKVWAAELGRVRATIPWPPGYGIDPAPVLALWLATHGLPQPVGYAPTENYGLAALLPPECDPTVLLKALQTKTKTK